MDRKKYSKELKAQIALDAVIGKTPAEIYWGREVARKAA